MKRERWDKEGGGTERQKGWSEREREREREREKGSRETRDGEIWRKRGRKERGIKKRAEGGVDIM